MYCFRKYFVTLYLISCKEAKKMTKNKGNRTIAIGLMLFALFFGAGNLIFPASMGQSSGTNVWYAVGGFIITGVGMPLLGVLAMG